MTIAGVLKLLWLATAKLVLEILQPSSFNTVLIRLVARREITLLLKILWNQHHILYVKIVYEHNMTRSKVHA